MKDPGTAWGRDGGPIKRLVLELRSYIKDFDALRPRIASLPLGRDRDALLGSHDMLGRRAISLNSALHDLTARADLKASSIFSFNNPAGFIMDSLVPLAQEGALLGTSMAQLHSDMEAHRLAIHRALGPIEARPGVPGGPPPPSGAHGKTRGEGKMLPWLSRGIQLAKDLFTSYNEPRIAEPHGRPK